MVISIIKQELSVNLLNRNPERYISINRNIKKNNIKIGKCKWCGAIFVRKYAPEKYCCEYCRNKSREEQSRRKSIDWYHRNKNRLSEKQRYGLGSGRLGGHRKLDFNKESAIIHNELVRLNIRKR